LANPIDYVYFAGKRIARVNASNTVYYYFDNHLGSSRAIVQDGVTPTLCYDADFYPYGIERTPYTNTCSQNYKFTGKERDSESGLDNFGARYDSSQCGRFMTPDPANASGLAHMDDPQSWNGYAYARNNPLVYTDPNGPNYMVCQYDTAGNKTNCADLTNDQYKQYQQQNSDVHSTASGDLYLTNENGSETKIGNASYYNEKDVAAAQQITQYGPPLEFLGEIEGLAIMGPGMGMLEGTLPEASLAGGSDLGGAANNQAQATANGSTGTKCPCQSQRAACNATSPRKSPRWKSTDKCSHERPSLARKSGLGKDVAKC